jgi:hypothetical protein
MITAEPAVLVEEEMAVVSVEALTARLIQVEVVEHPAGQEVQV